MTALIIAGGLVYAGIGLALGDFLMVFAGVAILALPAATVVIRYMVRRTTQTKRADLIAGFAAEQEEKAKGNRHE